MHDIEETYPLFIVRKFLPEVDKKMKEFFNNPCENFLEELDRYIDTVINVGELYRDNLKNLMNQIRSYPQEADFLIPISDSNEKIWNSKWW